MPSTNPWALRGLVGGRTDDDDDGGGGGTRPKTSPGTKRRSITHLSELIRRQRLGRGLGAITEETTPAIRTSESPPSSPTQPNSRLIQVAIRCRARVARPKRRIGDEAEAEDDGADATAHDDAPSSFEDEDDAFVGDGGHDDGDGDGLITFDHRPDPGHLPSLLVPAHALAVGVGGGPRRRFEFDHVFSPACGQEELYGACVQAPIAAVLDRATAADPGAAGNGTAPEAHVTVIAYGQTGTGKTYTMGLLGHAHHRRPADWGIIPRALAQILAHVAGYNASTAGRARGRRLVASMSFLQIYLESIQDLLVPAADAMVDGPAARRRSSTASSMAAAASAVRANRHGPHRDAIPGLPVRLQPSTSTFYVDGLNEIDIDSLDDARFLLESAAAHRVFAATAKNRTSSRSHTLLTIALRQVRDDRLEGDPGDGDDGPVDSTCATISFVDLAGSERVEGTLHFLHATRKRQELRIREAKFINRSLSALGGVIAALAARDRRPKVQRNRPIVHLSASPPKRPPGHIRFRDSQLTKLLQARLMNGRGRLLLIATIDDQPSNLAETLSTIKFAAECRRVERSSASHLKLEQRRREESLLKQVFNEVKVMYEEREARLRLEYEETIAQLRAELQERRASSPPPSDRLFRGSYAALCSLADLSRPPRGAPATVAMHPPADSGPDQTALVEHIASLYQEIKAALSSTRSTRTSKQTTAVVPKASKSRPRAIECKPTATTTNVESRCPQGPQRRTLTPAEETEFRSIARLLMRSGELDGLASICDELGGPWSQLDDDSANM